MGDYYDWTYYKDYMMECKEYINEIKIADTITYIGSYAFSDTNISTISLPSSLSAIGTNAFAGCKKLYEITIPNNVETIGSHAFEYSYLSKIVIPQNTVLNGYAIFEGCGDISIYGYKGSSAEEYAIENDIPFVALDNNNLTYSEEDLLNFIKQKSGKDISSYIYIDMDNDKAKEIVAAVLNDSFKYDIWYCSSDGSNCCYVTSIGRGNDYNNFRAIKYDKEAHVIFNCGNNFGNAQDYAIFAPYLGGVGTIGQVMLDTSGFASITDKNTVFVNVRGYDPSDGHAIETQYELIYANYRYTKLEKEFASTMTQFTNPVNVGDSLLFNVVIRDSNGKPVNISDLPTELTYTVSVSDTKCIRIDDESIDLTGAFIKATAIGEGTATITVTFSNGVSATSTVKVGKSETGDDNTDTSSDSRYDYLYLDFKPKNLSYTYSADTESFNAASTECEINFSCIDLLQNGLFMDVSKIVVTPPKGFSINGKGERVPHEYTYIVPEPINGGSDGDISEHFVLYPPTKEFLKGNPLTDSYEAELTVTVYGDDDFVKTFKEDINVIYKAPSSYAEIQKIDYIEQHVTSAARNEWTKYNNAISLKNSVGNSALEVTHGIWKTITITDKSVNLDAIGIYEEIAANDYNLILLDMFNSIEGYEITSSIFKESEDFAAKDWLDIIKGCIKSYANNDIKYNNAINKAEKEFNKALAEFSKDNDLKKFIKSVKDSCYETGIDFDKKTIPNGILTTYNISSEVLNGLSTAMSTFDDVIGNAETVISYRMYKRMSDEYVELLRQMYDEADKLSTNSWEVADLKKAIAYSLNYHYDDMNQAFYDVVKNGAKQFYKLGVEESAKKFIKDNSIKFIQTTFTKDVNASSKFLKDKIGNYITAVQDGFKYGVKISDKLFDMNNREELYVKIKEYGVLEEVLYNVLDKRASTLLSAKTIDDQYSAAQYYDKAYKMYMFVEEAAATNAAKYERTFEIADAVKAVLTFFNSNDWLVKQATKHVESATRYEAYADSIRKNVKCHNGYDFGKDEYADILLNYELTMEKHKIVIISCPVTVNVYDENKSLVGTLSSQYTNVKQGYEIYMYRIEETDSNVICVPTDYTIEVIGLDKGTMSIIASYFDGDEEINTVFYNNIPIDSKYKAKVDINEETFNLSEINPNLPSQPIPPTPPSDSNGNNNNQGSSSSSSNAISTNSPISTTFNVKVENKITNKTTKVKATRTGENVTINLGKDNNGYYANAYTSDGKLLDAVKIKNGKAKFNIPNDIDFYIIVDEASYLDYEDVSSGAGIYDFLNETTTSLCIIVIIFIAIAGSLSIVAIKRFSKNKH